MYAIIAGSGGPVSVEKYSACSANIALDPGRTDHAATAKRLIAEIPEAVRDPKPGGEANAAMECFRRLAPELPGAQGVTATSLPNA
jgi:hypothetical protein